jgi:hypothetical protein
MEIYLIVTVEHAAIPHANQVYPRPTNDCRWYVPINGDISLQGLSVLMVMGDSLRNLQCRYS